jgi:hypothetical protein
MTSRRSDPVTGSFPRFALATLLCAVTALGTWSDAAAGTTHKTFGSPAEAAQALVDALSTSDDPEVEVILGPKGEKLLRSGDLVADDRARWRFLGAYAKKHGIAQENDAKAVLHVGEEDWPLPIPIVRASGAWRFDTAAAADEILNRRIGKNELSAIQVCLAIVDAQREYAAVDRDGSGVRAFARRMASTQGKKDGLYWPTGEGEGPSPLGPLAARAAQEGYAGLAGMDKPEPYHGYFYRILTAQGKDAAGGAYDYLVKGKMIGGFALVAYPARYGVSGIMTFIVNNDGVVYEQDLGQHTHAVARKMAKFNPDKAWRRTSMPARASP